VTAKGFLVPAPMPPWLSRLAALVSAAVVPLAAAGGANHVLINSYRPGEGIMVRDDTGRVLP
jgi:alkylated DNA repair dioxygenase AlkB